MILLEETKYSQVIEPLKTVTINHLFVKAVLEYHIQGKVYVDNVIHPKTFYVVHPYGMSLLFGDCNNMEFNKQLRNYALNIDHSRTNFEWMQAFPENWHPVIEQLFDGKIISQKDNTANIEYGMVEVNGRVNFRFNREKYLKFKSELLLPDFPIIRTDSKVFQEIKGAVVPANFWNNADDFVSRGMGFTVIIDDKPASTAYSAFVIDNKLEIGIETMAEFRGKGLAQYSCSALIDYCIEMGYEPVWSCKRENNASYQLAQKLGFEPILEIPFYRLSK
jgi:GNAT superfamily N-acetyltransferase